MNLSNYKNQKIHFLNFIDIILKYFPFILIIILCFSYLFINKNFTAFEHNTLSFNAGLEFYDNREEIDYITSSILESPKIIIIRFVNFFFDDWYFGTYYFKVFLNLNLFLSIWFLYYSIIRYNFEYNNKVLNNKINLLIILFFLLFYLGIFRKFHGYGGKLSPLGWGGIQYFNDFSSMLLSFVAGAYAISFSLNKKKIINFATIILFTFSTFIHPAMGVCNLILLFIFYEKNFNLNYFKNFLIFIFFSILIPIIILKIYVPEDVVISGKEFFEIYVKDRHPHHYIVSNKILKITYPNGNLNLYSYLVWIFLLSFLSLFSFIFAKKILSINLLILIIFILIPISQFIFVEKLNLKLFTELGITRFTSCISLIFFFQIILNFLNFMETKKKIYKDNQNFSDKKKLSITKYIFLTIIISFFISKLTLIHPLNDKNFLKYQTITSWVKNNIKSDKEFFIEHEDLTFVSFLRVYGKQKIFFNEEHFPFSPNYIKKYIVRLKHQRRIRYLLKNGNYSEMIDNLNESIGYIILEVDKFNLKTDSKEIIYKDEFYMIIKVY